MLFLHEVHSVVGEAEQDFETAYRQGWMPSLAAGDDARLLWYLHQAHGSGPAYTVVTVTAVRDGAAYQRLAESLTAGPLADWRRSVDELRHHVDGKMLAPVDWSPLQDVDLSSVPADGAEHEPSLYMEDTGWPTAPLDDYIAFWDTDYFRHLQQAPAGRSILAVEACFQVAYGTHRRPEAMLLQKILSYDLLLGLIAEPREYDPATWPGSYMHGGLEYRDQWESKLLRTATWSPLF
ncbi:MAG TPA: hypothetical protein VGO78_27850 [Acidimicrobiales bacterium]|jgi:hypothetical protein|nr:hypothetical protein [Acidimicrobiales bacterium]